MPNKQNIEPSYYQKEFSVLNRNNKLQTLVSWVNDTEDDSLKIHQDARISRIDLSENISYNYSLKNEDYGIYLMVVEGEISIDNNTISKRNAVGIQQTKGFEVIASKASQLLFIEVPIIL